MELTKQDTKMTKGLAIVFMVILHLFCRKTDLPYSCIKLGSGIPLVYYIGLIGDCCVAIYCFCSGWWFLLTYILLVVISRPMHLAVKRLNLILIIVITLFIYLVAYIRL